MKEIALHRISKVGNTITYLFSASEELVEYFSEKPFVIEYPENIEAVPDAIAAIPFVCKVNRQCLGFLSPVSELFLPTP